MNVYDFAPDLDLSKEGEGSIFVVKGKAVMVQYMLRQLAVQELGITVVRGVFFYDCHKDKCYKDKCLLSRSQAAIEGEQAAPWAKACGCRAGRRSKQSRNSLLWNVKKKEEEET